MSTATNYLEKTARALPFTAKGYGDLQKLLLTQKDEIAKATAKSAKNVGQQFKGTGKSLKKMNKKVKKMDKDSTKKSLMYGGGAGTAGGYAGGKASNSGEEV